MVTESCVNELILTVPPAVVFCSCIVFTAANGHFKQHDNIVIFLFVSTGVL